jgi:hypothetical protein
MYLPYILEKIRQMFYCRDYAYSTGPHFRNYSSPHTGGLYRRLRRLNLMVPAPAAPD